MIAWLKKTYKYCLISELLVIYSGTFIGDATNNVDAVNAVEAWNTLEEAETTDAFAFEQICDVAADDALIEAEKVFADMMAAEEDAESEEERGQ